MTTLTMSPTDHVREGKSYLLQPQHEVRGMKLQERQRGNGRRIDGRNGNDGNGNENNDTNGGQINKRLFGFGQRLEDFREAAAERRKKIGSLFFPSLKGDDSQQQEEAPAPDPPANDQQNQPQTTEAPKETQAPAPVQEQPVQKEEPVQQEQPVQTTQPPARVVTTTQPLPTTTTTRTTAVAAPVALPVEEEVSNDVNPVLTPLPAPISLLGPGAVEPTDVPRKGVSEDTVSFTAIFSTSASTSGFGSRISLTPVPKPNNPSTSGLGDPTLKPENEKSSGGAPVLIAAGAIGALVVILAAFYFFLRKRRGETIAMFARRKSHKYRPKVFREEEKQSIQPPYELEAPPGYTDPAGYGSEKTIPSQRQMEGFYNPDPLPVLTIPPRARAVTVSSNHSSQPDDGSPITSAGYSPTRVLLPRPQPESFYHSRAGSDLNEVFIQHGLNSGSVNIYKELPGDPPPSELSAKFPSKRTTLSNSNAQATYNTDNRMSMLSSLSSGFGDGLIIQDTESIAPPGVVAPMPPRGQHTTRFSWQTAVSKDAGMGPDRSSVYTTASVETAPRFRGVNSWVAQQSGRVERQRMMDSQIPAMPAVPPKLQSAVAPIRPLQLRRESDISAFNYHPGEEVRMNPGTRVASSVLDVKLDTHIYTSSG